jgi:hypothetical protein
MTSMCGGRHGRPRIRSLIKCESWFDFFEDQKTTPEGWFFYCSISDQ